jgi:hypothetical protein
LDSIGKGIVYNYKEKEHPKDNNNKDDDFL